MSACATRYRIRTMLEMDLPNPPNLQDIYATLRTIDNLPDNWDSYGAPAPNPLHTSMVWQLVMDVATRFINLVDHQISLPRHIAPYHGGIGLEWGMDPTPFRNALEVDYSGTNQWGYLRIATNPNGKRTYKESEDLNYEEILEVVTQYVKDQLDAH